MQLSAAVAILTAVVAPFLIAVITRPDWTSVRKRYVALAVCVVLGVIVAVATGQIAGVPGTVQAWVQQFIIDVGIVVSLAQGFYMALKDPVAKVEAKTSPSTPA